MVMDFDAGELPSVVGSNSGGLGEGFVEETNGLIRRRVGALARQRAEKTPKFFGVGRVRAASDVFSPSLEGFVSGL